MARRARTAAAAGGPHDRTNRPVTDSAAGPPGSVGRAAEHFDRRRRRCLYLASAVVPSRVVRPDGGPTESAAARAALRRPVGAAALIKNAKIRSPRRGRTAHHSGLRRRRRKIIRQAGPADEAAGRGGTSAAARIVR